MSAPPKDRDAALRDIAAITEPLVVLLAMGGPLRRYELLSEVQKVNRLILAARTDVCSRCKLPIKDFEPPTDGTTAGYYVASAWPRYANDGDVYICDACMWRDPLYILDHGVVA